MSIEAMTAVLHHSKAKGTALNILLGIANHEGDGGAWPSRCTLAKYGRCTERRVKQIVSELVAAGELEVDYQAGGLADMDDHRRPNRYRVLVCCPVDCDGTSQHRSRRERTSRRTGETGFPPGGKSASPGGGETGFPLTVLEEPPNEPTGTEQSRTTTFARFAPSGGGDAADDSWSDPWAGNDQAAEATQPPRSAARDLTEARIRDREMFRQLVGEQLTSHGAVWNPKGTHGADVWYQVFRTRKKKPLKWPGRFLEAIHASNPTTGVEDWLADQGLELPAG